MWSMDTKKGRPKLKVPRKRVHVTLTSDDFDTLTEFGKLTGVSVAGFIRAAIEPSIPDLKELIKAAREAQNGNSERATGRAASLLAKHIQGAAELQQDMFDDKK